jgi:proton glutamate symport protein
VRRSLTVLCVLGVVLGILLGTALQHFDPVSGGRASTIASGLLRAWTNAFRLVVPFLVVSQLYVAVAARRPSAVGAAKLGVVVPAVFVVLWTVMALATIVAMLGLLSLPLFRELSLSIPTLGEVPAPGSTAARPSWIDELIPPNLLAAAAGNNILPLMLFTLVLAFAAKRLPLERQRVFELGFATLRDTMFVIVDWLVRPAPLMLLAFGLRFASLAGLRIGGVLLVYAVLKIALLLAGIALLYVVASFAGRFSLAHFARALSPAQLTAVATRSSLATVPALLAAANRDLRLPAITSSVVIPLAGATLKVSRAISEPVQLLFLAHVLGIQLGPQQLAVFLLLLLPMAIATTGTPRPVSNLAMLPVYLSLGIPAQYYLLTETITAISDPFDTMVNTTGYMTANVLVARMSSEATPPSEAIAGFGSPEIPQADPLAP